MSTTASDSYTSVTATGHLHASFAVHREHICGVLGQGEWSGTGQEIGGRCCGVVLHGHPLELSLSPGTRRTCRTEGLVQRVRLKVTQSYIRTHGGEWESRAGGTGTSWDAGQGAGNTTASVGVTQDIRWDTAAFD